MNVRAFLLPTIALSLATLLFAPLPSSRAFSLLGNDLAVNERDVRVFNNFADTTANDNTTPSSQFPGRTGLELAVWKGIVEWGSLAHGDGSGDSTQATLGSGAANFDAFWTGSTSSPGLVDSNIVSKIDSCSSGVLAFCESSVETGWRIRFCESWVWNDGPGAISGGQFDLQGVMAHEYGHALGLGHSSFSNATMFPSVGSGVTATRSIEADDIAGVQAIYGARSASKPTIVATVALGSTLVIHGTNFTATNNQVWFCPAAVSAPSADARIVLSGIESNGTVLSVSIPAEAGPGDVIVKAGFSGGTSVSNAFPTDLVGTFGIPPFPSPNLTDVSPAVLEALIPGTAQSVTLTGTALDRVTALSLDGVAIPASRYTLVSPTTITLDMPQASRLGSLELGVSDGVVSDAFPVTIVVPATPKYELGNGNALNVVDRDAGLPFLLAGVPGSLHRVVASGSNLPSTSAFVSLALGNQFTDIFIGGNFVIPASGWLAIQVPSSSLGDPGPTGATFYSQSIDLTLPFPLATSNFQSMVLVR